MRFGTYFFLQAPPGRTGAEILPEEVDQMVLAEDLGFDSVWLTEHHYADYGLSSAPRVLLARLLAEEVVPRFRVSASRGAVKVA